MGNLLVFKPGTLDGQEVLDSLPPFKEIFTKYRPTGFPAIPNTDHKEHQERKYVMELGEGVDDE